MFLGNLLTLKNWYFTLEEKVKIKINIIGQLIAIKKEKNVPKKSCLTFSFWYKLFVKFNISFKIQK